MKEQTITKPVPALLPWSTKAKLIASALVVFHLGAVFLAPMWFASGQQSPVIAPLMAWYRPYINAMFLNHGYAFFAPNPGPTHLMRYELTFDNGRAKESAVFPNLAEEWPRLLYHRHFMLSETLYTYSNFPPLSEDAPPEVKAEHAARQQQYELLKKSFSNHAAAVNHAVGADVHRIEHRPLYPYEVLRDRKRLDAEDTFRDLDAPQATPEDIQGATR